MVFLFDLFLWESVAFARLESTIAMSISPDEDKIVCLESSGQAVLINLHGLKSGLPLDFQLPLDFRLPEENCHPEKTKVILPPDQYEFREVGVNYLYDEDDQISQSFSESSDEDRDEYI